MHKSFYLIAALSMTVAVLLVAPTGHGAQAQAKPGLAPSIGFGPVHGFHKVAHYGFYDGHKDEYVNTDVSSKSQASRFHLNFGPVLRLAIPKSTSPMYFVVGRRAHGELTVFGSKP